MTKDEDTKVTAQAEWIKFKEQIERHRLQCSKVWMLGATLKDMLIFGGQPTDWVDDDAVYLITEGVGAQIVAKDATSESNGS